MRPSLAIPGTSIPWVLLHVSANHWYIPRPAESHHLFGAGFLFIGSLMAAESLSGRVWYRNLVRMLMFPSMLVFLGWGMVAVTAIETNARLVHLSMGLPMIAGGWAEGRYRLGGLERKFADVLIVPSLVLASIDTALFHLNGPATSPGVITHGGLALLALVVAGLRLYQSGNVVSLGRSLLLSAAVMAIGLDLWIDAFYQ